MASIHREKNGHRRILFVAPDKVRRCVRLGKMPSKGAIVVRQHIETILSHLASNTTLEAETATWLGNLTDSKLYARLVRAGLAKERKRPTDKPTTLAAFLDYYIGLQNKIEPGTRANYLQTKRWLLKFFDGDRSLKSINAGDAEELRSFMEKKLAENTIRRHLKRARQFFRHAKRKKLIRRNPFASMKGLASKGNKEKFFFVSPEDTRKLLDACPSQEWRVVVALSRFGGLRCPSEHSVLKQKSIDWSAGRIEVSSPKTKRHPGKESRVIPLFPELRTELEAAFDPESTHILQKLRGRQKNLRTTFLKIIERAGLKPWPKLFHNLRASRQTELSQRFPAHVVCEWMGNSIEVGAEHYLRTLDIDFERAINPSQNPSQSVAVSPIPALQRKTASPMEGEAVHDVTSTYESVQVDSMTLGE